MSPLLTAIVLVLLAYLLGSVSGSLVLGRFRGIDIRQHGSGNAGGTNAFRTRGWKFALGVVVIDIGKGALAAWLALRHAPQGLAPGPQAIAALAGFAAIVGHVWPLWHGFRGGKGAATAVGVLLVLWPAAVPAMLLAWLLVLGVAGYVGLATVLAGFSLPLLAWAVGTGGERAALATAIALFLAYTHRGNLQRLRAGTESRFERARFLYRLVARL